jgi:uncharacterized protein involved in high-affinity Fe2+ transport
MRFRKSDFAIVREAEENGLVAAMTSIVSRNRTDLNNELSDYFRSKLSNYQGTFGEDESDDALYGINEYLEENNIDKYSLDFPISSGTDIHLIPIGENIKLKVLVADEYHGDGDYEKYVDMSSFLINEDTTKRDVDLLVGFIGKYID